MDIVEILKDPDLLDHKRVLVPAAISDAADEIERLRAEKAEAEVTKLRADLDDALETLAAIHHYAGRVPKESIKAAVERVIPGLARKGEGGMR